MTSHDSLSSLVSYGTKSIFLRELLANSNDALEKLRLTSLTDKEVAIGYGELNVTIKAEKDSSEVGGLGRLIIHGQSQPSVGEQRPELTI